MSEHAWLSVLAHELRTPLAAILGYQELLEDGVFGDVDDRAMDALVRIRLAAQNLSTLVDGMAALAAPDTGGDGPGTISLRRLVGQAADALRFEAEGRGVTLEMDGADHDVLCTENCRRAVVLALGAAIKASPGRTLRVAVHADGVSITGIEPAPFAGALDITDPHVSGPALRVHLAHRVAAAEGGSVTMEEEGHGAGPRIRVRVG